MTKLEKQINQKRLHSPLDTIGKTIKAFAQWGYTQCIIFTDDTFLITTAHEYRDCIEFEHERTLTTIEMKCLGLITDEQYQESLKRESQSRKSSQTYRDKKEYERLKKIFEGK